MIAARVLRQFVLMLVVTLSIMSACGFAQMPQADNEYQPTEIP